MRKHVLLVEDDRALRASLAQTLDLADIKVTQTGSYIEAKDHISANFDGVVLTDIRMPGKDGFDVLQLAKQRDQELPVIVLTGEGDIPMAVRAMSEGAHDFLTKPCPPDALVKVLGKALELRKLTLKTRTLERQLERGDVAAVNFPGPSPAAQNLRKSLRHYAEIPVGVHFSGAEGSGKRIACHTLHALSDATGPFLSLDCRDLAPETIQQAAQDAQDGTLCLRWLDGSNPEQQQMVLRLMEMDGFRLLTTSTAPLLELRRDGLNPDLFYALDVATILVPGLVQRKDDILEIFESFVRQHCRILNRPMQDTVTHRAIVAAKEWPANLPELRNYAQRVALGLQETALNPKRSGLSDQIEAFERGLIVEALARSGGRAALAAQDLNLPRKTFYDKLKRHNLKPEDFKRSL